MIDLAAETDRLLDFAAGSRHPDGGFAWLRSDGTPDLERPRELWITTRMTYVSRSARCWAGRTPRSSSSTALESLRSDFRDSVHGGWFAQVGGSKDKRAYEHVFVVLAAASAGDSALLGEALEVLDDALLGRARRGPGRRLQPRLDDARGLPRREREHARRRGDARDRGPAVARARGADHAAARGRQPPAAQRALRRRVAAAAGLQPHGAGASVPALRRDDRALVRVGTARLHARRRPLRGGRTTAVRGRDRRRLGRQRLRLHRRLGRAARHHRPAALGPVRGDRRRRGAGRGRAAGGVVGARRARTSSIASDGSWRPELDPSNQPSTTSGTASPTSTTRCRRR